MGPFIQAAITSTFMGDPLNSVGEVIGRQGIDYILSIHPSPARVHDYVCDLALKESELITAALEKREQYESWVAWMNLSIDELYAEDYKDYMRRQRRALKESELVTPALEKGEQFRLVKNPDAEGWAIEVINEFNELVGEERS